jgi:hypothetical protein
MPSDTPLLILVSTKGLAMEEKKENPIVYGECGYSAIHEFWNQSVTQNRHINMTFTVINHSIKEF